MRADRLVRHRSLGDNNPQAKALLIPTFLLVAAFTCSPTRRLLLLLLDARRDQIVEHLALRRKQA